MNSDRPNPPVSANPFVRPGQSQPTRPTAPNWDPFKGPPEPERSIPEAELEAIRRAWGEWREFLPHGLSLADYEPYRLGSIRAAAISSATVPLELVLSPDEAAPAAEVATDMAFENVAKLLSTYETRLLGGSRLMVWSVASHITRKCGQISSRRSLHQFHCQHGNATEERAPPAHQASRPSPQPTRPAIRCSSLCAGSSQGLSRRRRLTVSSKST